MADADRDNPAESVKIPPSAFVEHVLSFALYDHQRSFVVEKKPRIQKLST